MTRYVGIDPSTSTGYVILNEYGKVELAKEIAPQTKRDPERFLEIAQAIIEPLTWRDDIICIEGFSYGSRGKGVSTQYGIGWLIRGELIRNGYTYYELSPNSVKKFATGKGNVKKDAMVLPIFKRWGFESESDNIRDAYILAQIARALDGKGDLLAYQTEVLKKVTK